MRKIFFSLLTVTLAIIFILVSLELILSIYSRLPGNQASNFYIRLEQLSQKQIEDSGRSLECLPAMYSDSVSWFKTHKFFYRPSILLGYEYEPGQGIVNSMGLIGKEYKIKKDAGVFRILLLGDSIAASDKTRIVLEHSLNSNSQIDKDYCFEIWNSAVPSWNIRNYALFLKHKGVTYNPDMVLIFLCLNDLGIHETLVYYRTKDNLVAYYFPKSELIRAYVPNSFLLLHSYLYRTVTFIMNRYLVSKAQLNNDTWGEAVEDFKLIQNICTENHIRLLAVVYPYLKPLSGYSPEELKDYSDILKILKELNWDFIDLRDYLSEEEIISFCDGTDYFHPLFKGEKIIAGIIYDFLVDKKLVPLDK